MAPSKGKGRSKRPKRSKVRARKKANHEADFAGRDEETTTFPVFLHSEPKAAAYLGFHDRESFRRFEFSYVVVLPFLIAKKYCSRVHPSKALDLLRDISRDQWEETFPVNLEALTKKYAPSPSKKGKQVATPVKGSVKSPSIEKVNQNYLYAGLVRFIFEQIQRFPTLTAEQKINEQRQAVDEFHSTFANWQLPMVDIEEISMPILGPLPEFHEQSLTPFSRIITALKRLGQMTYQSKWPEYSHEQVFQHQTISPEHIPTYMRTSAKDSADSPATPALEAKDFTVMISDIPNDFLNQFKTRNQELQNEGRFRINPRPQKLLRDPRGFDNAEEWRDLVRHQYGLQQAGLQIVSIEMKLDNEGDGIDIYTEDAHTPWDRVLETITPAKGVLFKLMLRTLEHGEAFEFEFSDVPSMLRGDLAIVHDDIEVRTGIVEEIETARIKALVNTPSIQTPIHDARALFDSDAEFLAYFEGRDIRNPQILLQWQKMVCNIVGAGPTKQHSASKALPSQVGEEVDAMELDSIADALQREGANIPIPDYDEYSKVLRLLGNTSSLVGPYIDAAKVVLNMQRVGAHRNTGLDRSRCNSLPGCTAEFLDNQVTAAVFAISRVCEEFPVDSSPPDERSHEFNTALESVKGPYLGGATIAHSTGLGKTKSALLAMSWLAEFDEPWLYRPMLVLAPAGPVCGQWAEEILRDFGNLEVIIAGNDDARKKYPRHWVSSTAVKEAPFNLENWPEHLRYVFDPTDPRAAKTIILSSYEAWVTRTVTIEGREEDVSDTPLIDLMVTQWDDIFSLICLDEAHRIRNMATFTHQSVKKLLAPIYLFLTATPIISQLKEILAPLTLLWENGIKQRVVKNHEVHNFFLNSAKDYSVLEALSNLPITHPKRLLAICPDVIRSLLAQDFHIIAKYFHVMEELLIVKVSPASSLKRSPDGEEISLQHIIPRYEVLTQSIRYESHELCEMQLWHRYYCRLFSRALHNFHAREDSAKENTEPRQSWPKIAGPLRNLTVNSASPLLSRLTSITKRLGSSNDGGDEDEGIKRLGRNTHSEDVQFWRNLGHKSDWLIKMVHRTGDLPINTQLEKLHFLAYGSPKLRAILKHIQQVVLNQTNTHRKLLVIDQVPVNAWFFEICLQALRIGTATLHAGLSPGERASLVADFNDPNSWLKVLLTTYPVGSIGINLHNACSYVLLLCPSDQFAIEVQAYGRVIRIGQTEDVRIIRIFCEGSHDTYRLSTQREKALKELATKAFSNEMREYLVTLLNEGNKLLHSLHQMKQGQVVSNAAKASSTSLYHHETGSMSGDSESELNFQPAEDKDLDVEDQAILQELRIEDLDLNQREFNNLSLREQERIDQTELHLQQLLRLDPNKVYTTEDLEQPGVMERGLRLLFEKLIGQSGMQPLQLNPHIQYTALSSDVAKMIAAKLLVEEKEYINRLDRADIYSYTPGQRTKYEKVKKPARAASPRQSPPPSPRQSPPPSSSLSPIGTRPLYNSRTKRAELAEFCRAAGLDDSGTKADLIERLNDHWDELSSS